MWLYQLIRAIGLGLRRDTRGQHMYSESVQVTDSVGTLGDHWMDGYE